MVWFLLRTHHLSQKYFTEPNPKNSFLITVNQTMFNMREGNVRITIHLK